MVVRKVINGTIVDIDNLDIFIKAEEGRVLRNKESINTVSTVCSTKESIRYAKIYMAMCESLPFPLNQIEDDIKYAVIGNLMVECIKDTADIWVNEGLFIRLQDNRAIKFRYYGYTILDNWEKEGKSIDIDGYNNSIGYTEYKWVLSQLLGRKTTPNFYVQFMRSLVQAVGFDTDAVRDELHKMLEIEEYKESTLKGNTIINVENNFEYLIDIYYKEKRATGEKSTVISLVNETVTEKETYTKVYGYNVYVRECDSDKNPKPLVKTQLIGMHHLFNRLVGIKNGLNEDLTRNYTGLIIDRDIIFSVDNIIYTTKAYRVSEVTEIADRAELIGHSLGSIYYKQTDVVKGNITREVVYRYSVKDRIKHICNIEYR